MLDMPNCSTIDSRPILTSQNMLLCRPDLIDTQVKQTDNSPLGTSDHFSLKKKLHLPFYVLMDKRAVCF